MITDYMITEEYVDEADRLSLIADYVDARGYRLYETQNYDGSNYLIFGPPQDFYVLDENENWVYSQEEYDAAPEEKKLKVDQVVAQISDATFTQIDTWVDNNVTDVSDVKSVLKRLLKLMKLSLRNI